MSQKLPIISGKQMMRFLKSHGFKLARRKGSHVILVRGDEEITVPDHKELSQGVTLIVLKEIGISRDEFIRAMRRN